MRGDDLLPYAAGFFDGEGCVDIRWRLSRSSNGKSYERFELRVNVPQVVDAPLLCFQRNWGGTVAKRKNGPCHDWVITGAAAARFLSDVRPWLMVKADEADIAIEFAATMRTALVNTAGSKGVDPLGAETRERRRELHVAIRAARTAKGIKGKANAVAAPLERYAHH